MLLDTPYEFTDGRKDVENNLGPVVLLSATGDTIVLRGPAPRAIKWQIPDDDEAYEERDEGRTIILYTEQGRITLTRLTVAQHEEMGIVMDLPDLDTQEQVDAFWLQALG